MSTPTASRMQQLLEVLASTRPGPEPASKQHDPAFAAVVASTRDTGWDPKEVWLNRVHRPREGRRTW
jgi:hypothetical protein